MRLNRFSAAFAFFICVLTVCVSTRLFAAPLSSDSLATAPPDTILKYGVALSQKAIGAAERASALGELALSYSKMRSQAQAESLWFAALAEVNRLAQPAARSSQLLELARSGIALGLQDTARAIAAQIPSATEKAMALFALAKRHYEIGEKDKFKALAENAWDAAEKLEHDTLIVAMLSRLSLLYLKSGDAESGKEALNQALSIKCLPSLETATLFGALAAEFFQAAQPNEGEQLLKNALASLSKMKDKESASSARLAISLLLIKAGELGRAQSLISAIANPMDRLSAMQQLASGFVKRNQNEQAAQLAQQMRQIAQSLRNTSDRATALGLIAAILAEAKFENAASSAADDALAAINAIPVAFDRSTVLGELAADFAEARLFAKAELALSRVSVPQHRAIAAYQVGEAFAHAQLPEKAKPLFAEAFALRHQFANAEVKARALSRIAIESLKSQSDIADSAFAAALVAIADVSASLKRADLLRALAADLASIGKIQYALLAIQKMENAAQMAIALSDLARICHEKNLPFSNANLATLKSIVESSQ